MVAGPGLEVVGMREVEISADEARQGDVLMSLGMSVGVVDAVVRASRPGYVAWRYVDGAVTSPMPAHVTMKVWRAES